MSVGVMHMVDTLNMGGTERVAVGMVNQLAKRGHRSFLCTTRTDGPLGRLVSPNVGRLSLNRTRTIQFNAIRRLVAFIRSNDIDVLHAHGSSILTANLASRMRPFPRILWHDHFGTNERQERPVWFYRWLVQRVGGIVAVSRPLADWSRSRLQFPSDRVWCVPNFVDEASEAMQAELDLPGKKGLRIVCVANLRPVKDHVCLLQAMKQVVRRQPDAQLILVGGLSDSECVAGVRARISDDRLTDNVTILGERDDVRRILSGCDIGVLSSTSEGLPLSLLEYGATGLATVVTDVGQCGVVVGDAGYVVPPSDPDQLANKIMALLDDNDSRRYLGQQLKVRVEKQFGADNVMDQWIDIYDKVRGTR